MKILCVSDQIDPLVYTNSIKNRFADVDIILSAGDLPLDYLEFIVSSLNKPLLFVFGNHHTHQMANRAFEGCGCIHVGSRVHKEEGLIVAGLGGSMRYNLGANQYTEFQMYMEIFKLIPSLLINRLIRGRFLDILLTHAAFTTRRTSATRVSKPSSGLSKNSNRNTWYTAIYTCTICRIRAEVAGWKPT